MKIRTLLFAGLLAAGMISIPSCSGKKATATTETKTVSIGLADDGKTFNVKTNEKFAATFNECIGCAQTWKVAVSNPDMITTLPNTYANKSCTNCVGGSQDNTFHFEAKKAGTATLTFTYFDKKVTTTIVVQ